jgi:hypothetical protein
MPGGAAGIHGLPPGAFSGVTKMTTYIDTNQTVADAILESRHRDRIVWISEPTDEDKAQLYALCDECVEFEQEGETVAEYWAHDPDDEDGMLWRVHTTTEITPAYCPICDGTGEGVADGVRCYACRGTGEVQR